MMDWFYYTKGGSFQERVFFLGFLFFILTGTDKGKSVILFLGTGAGGQLSFARGICTMAVVPLLPLSYVSPAQWP